MKKRRKHCHTKQRDLDRIRMIRIRFCFLVVLLFFFLLIFQLSNVFIGKRAFYQEKLFALQNQEVTFESAPRGRIYDRNYHVLVDNQMKLVLYYKAIDDITTTEEIDMARMMAQSFTFDTTKLTKRQIKEFFLLLYPEVGKSKITEEEWEALENRQLDQDDLYLLELERISDADLACFREEDLETAYVYQLMHHGYAYAEKVILSSLTDQEYAIFSEHSHSFPGFSVREDWERIYPYGDTFRSILGTVSAIPSDQKDTYLAAGYALTDRVGTSYLESQYESLLKGEKAVYRLTSSSEKESISGAKRGHDIVLTIDIELQQQVEQILEEELLKAKTEPNTEYFNKSFVVIQEPGTGEILAMAGKQVVFENGAYQVYDYTPGILVSPMTPGSVVKGATMLVGYNTGVISMGEYQMDECIKIAGTKKKCSHTNLGMINDITALAQSSNVYQFRIAMKVAGANYQYDQPLKIDTSAFDVYRKTLGEFGLGVKTGIDLPVESLGYIGTKTDAGLLLDLSMGQYDTYTPIQLSQYITTIASDGVRLQPHLLKEVYAPSTSSELGTLESVFTPVVMGTVTTKPEYLNRIKEGFRAVMTVGLGKGVMGTSPNPAGKTGTSESFLDTDGDGIIDHPSVSNAFVGFAPYENPTMTITVTSPDVEKPSALSYHSYVNRRIAKRVSSLFFTLYPVR